MSVYKLGKGIISFAQQDAWENYIVPGINDACGLIGEYNEKWWKDIRTGEPLARNMGEMLMLVVSEIAEAMEGHRKSLPDDKLPHREMLHVELADACIRIFDICAHNNIPLGDIIYEKTLFNLTRHDHTYEVRKAPGGKAY